MPFFQRMLGERLRRVLLVGSGYDLEPYHYAHLGNAVTALDFSHVALDWVRAVGEQRDIAAWFYEQYRDSLEDGIVWKRLDLEASRAAAAAEYVPGGSLQFVVADLFDYSPDEPFDGVRMSQGFGRLPEAEQHARLAWAFERTAPGGVCWCAFTGPEHRPQREVRVQQAVREAGFFPYLPEWYAWFWSVEPEWMETRDPDRKFQRESLARRAEEEADHRRRLAAGEKMAACLNATQILLQI